MSATDAASRRPSFALGFFSTLGGRVLHALLALPSSILISRVLGPGGKGALDLALLIPFIVTMLAQLGLGSAGSYLIGSRRYQAWEVLGTLTMVWIVLSFVLTPAYVTVAAAGALERLAPGVEVALMALGGLTIPLLIGRQYLGSVLLGEQRFVAHNSVQVLQGAAYLAGLLIFVSAMGLGARGGAIAGIVAAAACVIYLLAAVRGNWRGKPRWRSDILREAARYGVRGQAGDLLQYFNYRLDVIIVAMFWDTREVGLYTLAVSLAEFLWYIPNASALVVFPRTAGARDEAARFTPLVFRVTFLMTLAAAGLALAAGPVIPLVFGPGFRSSVAPFYVLLPGVVCLGAAKVLSADLSGRGLPGYNAIGSLISLVVTVALDLLLIPRHGAVGAGVASTLAYATSLLYTVIVWTRIARTNVRTLARFRMGDVQAGRDLIRRLAGRGRRA
jgi:O-antigen/teichoic acid export membrane protein